MSIPSPLMSSLPPASTHIMDFDLVTLDGRLVLVGSPDRDRLACTWEPDGDRWTTYQLDVPDERFRYTELTAIGAAVVDGRIVIGGGGDHQGFAMWDLETGKVRLSAQEGAMSSVVRADFGERSRMLVGFANTWGVQLWDPSVAEPEDSKQDDDDLGAQEGSRDSSPYDSLVDIDALECQSAASSAAAAGLYAGRPVVVAGGHHGGVLMWDIEEERSLAEFNDLNEMPTDFALAPVDGRTQVVAAGGRSLVLGDPESSEWGEPLTVPGGDITCMTAGTLHGCPFAVTGARDGTILVWDLAERRLMGKPLRGHSSTVYALRVADLHSCPVIISSAHCDSVHLWEFPS